MIPRNGFTAFDLAREKCPSVQHGIYHTVRSDRDAGWYDRAFSDYGEA